MALLKFKQGLAANLPAYSQDSVGVVYITSDSQEMKVDLPSGRVTVSDFVIVDNQAALDAIGTYHENLFYYVKADNFLKTCTKSVVNGEVTYTWKTINDLTELTSDITAISGRLLTAENDIDALEGRAATLETAVAGINASTVKTTKTFKVTKAVGNYDVGEDIEIKDIQQLIIDMLSEDVNPTRSKNYSASISLTSAGAKEVGYEFTPKFSFSTNSGEYTANGVTQPANVTYNSFYVEESGRPDGATADKSTSSSGSFAKFTVTDTTNYKLTGECKSTNGDIPKTYLGNDYDEDGKKEIRFMAKDWKDLSSGAVTGYRAMFYGYFDSKAIADPTAITSAQVRALSGERLKSGTTYETKTGPQTSLPSGAKAIKTNKMQQMFFAAPAGKYSEIKVANSTNGAPQTVTKATNIMVEGLNGYEAAAYDVFYVSNAGPESGETIFDVTLIS